MAKGANDLKSKLAEKSAGGHANGGNGAVQEYKPKDTFEALMLKHQREFERALPKSVGFDRFMRAALSTIRHSRDLRECEAVSVMGALMTAAQLGLEVGPLGHAYLVPFNDRKSGKKLAQLIIGYRGYLHLARQSGEIESVHVEPVHENDEFDYQLGLEPYIKHKPALKDRGAPILYYGVVRFKGGGYQLRVMTIDEIEQRRRRSKAGDSGPWVTDWDAMARKTVIRDMWRWLPVAVEQSRAEAADETIRMDLSADADPEPITVDIDYERIEDAEIAGQPDPWQHGQQQAEQPRQAVLLEEQP